MWWIVRCFPAIPSATDSGRELIQAIVTMHGEALIPALAI